jgi:hypothetical protein
LIRIRPASLDGRCEPGRLEPADVFRHLCTCGTLLRAEGTGGGIRLERGFGELLRTQSRHRQGEEKHDDRRTRTQRVRSTEGRSVRCGVAALLRWALQHRYSKVQPSAPPTLP